MAVPFASFITSIISSVAGAVTSPIFSVMAHLMTQALSSLLTSVATLWMKIPTPDLASTSSGAPSSTVQFLSSHLAWLEGIACLAGFSLSAVKLAWGSRREGFQNLARGLVMIMAVHVVGLGLIASLTTFGDKFSVWMIDGSIPHGQTFGGALTSTLAIGTTGGLSAMLVIILELFGVLMALVQMILLFVRAGMLVLLAGMLNFNAALSLTSTGHQMWKKQLGWLAAAVAYKPVASIVYATAFHLGSSQGSGATLNCIFGLFLFALALIALPALMRFVSPVVTGAAAGGAGAMMALGAGGAMLAIPTGARILRHSGSSGTSSGGADLDAPGVTGAPPAPIRPGGDSGSPSAGAGAGSAAASGAMVLAQAAKGAGQKLSQNAAAEAADDVTATTAAGTSASSPVSTGNAASRGGGSDAAAGAAPSIAAPSADPLPPAADGAAGAVAESPSSAGHSTSSAHPSEDADRAVPEASGAKDGGSMLAAGIAAQAALAADQIVNEGVEPTGTDGSDG